MRLTRLDPETARRLCDGRVAPDDAPPGYSGVAAVLAAARGAADSASDLVREKAAVTAMHGAVLERLDTPTIDPRRRHVRKKVLAAKTAAATTVVLLGAGAAAAAGTLPGAAQGTASDVLSKIGISVPGHNNSHANSRGQSTNAGNTGTKGSTGNTGSSNRQGNGPNAHALPGLCRAQIASAGHPNPNSVVPHVNCTGVTPAGGGSSTDSGTDQPSGPPSSTPVGPPSSTPPVSTPNHGGPGSSGTNSSTGLGKATGHDGGASTTGSGADSAGGGNAGTRP